MSKPIISHEELLRRLSYDPTTGIFRWRTAGRTASPKKIGQIVGNETSNGYLRVMLNDREYLLHRLAWFYMTGHWPKMLDHKDRNGTNNAFSNLREASSAQNKINCRMSNTTGFTGVCVRKNLTKPYRAAIEVSGKTRHLGYFETAEEAGAAYRVAAIKIWGEFAREVCH